MQPARAPHTLMPGPCRFRAYRVYIGFRVRRVYIGFRVDKVHGFGGL